MDVAALILVSEEVAAGRSLTFVGAKTFATRRITRVYELGVCFLENM